jgi:hypothetical protein
MRSAAFLDLFDSSTPASDQLKRIAEFVDDLKTTYPDATRNLIVYYVGHGYFGFGGRDYYLALASTDREVLDVTGLRVSSFGDVLKRRSKSFRIFYILDCCFSGEALGALQSGSEAVADLANAALRVEGRGFALETPRRGSALLCAASKDEVAFAPQGRELTMFSGGLMEALEHGDPELHSSITLSELCDLIWHRLRLMRPQSLENLVRPVVYAPDQTDGDISKHVALFPNLSFPAMTQAAEAAGLEKAAAAERERVAAEERERVAAEERERAAAGERERVAAEKRERAAAEERERAAAEERERVAAEERERAAAGERERVAAEKREKAAAGERERVAAEKRGKAEAAEREKAEAAEREKAEAAERESIAAAWRERAAAVDRERAAAAKRVAAEEREKAAAEEREKAAAEKREKAAAEKREKAEAAEREKAAAEEREKAAAAQRERVAAAKREKAAAQERERAIAAKRERVAAEEREKAAAAKRQKAIAAKRERAAAEERERAEAEERERAEAEEREKVAAEERERAEAAKRKSTTRDSVLMYGTAVVWLSIPWISHFYLSSWYGMTIEEIVRGLVGFFVGAAVSLAIDASRWHWVTLVIATVVTWFLLTRFASMEPISAFVPATAVAGIILMMAGGNKAP